MWLSVYVIDSTGRPELAVLDGAFAWSFQMMPSCAAFPLCFRLIPLARLSVSVSSVSVSVLSLSLPSPPSLPPPSLSFSPARQHRGSPVGCEMSVRLSFLRSHCQPSRRTASAS